MNTEELFDLIPHKNKFLIPKEEIVNYIKDLQENVDYKSRCEKAIEYIKSYKNDYAPYELSDYNIRELLNILGGDEE